MEHILKPENSVYNTISVVEKLDVVEIKISDNGECLLINLNKKELHSFIGTLLHVQQKMK